MTKLILSVVVASSLMMATSSVAGPSRWSRIRVAALQDVLYTFIDCRHTTYGFFCWGMCEWCFSSRDEIAPETLAPPNISDEGSNDGWSGGQYWQCPPPHGCP